MSLSVVAMIGLAAGAISLLMSKRGPFGVFDFLKRIGGTPLTCNVCRTGWIAVILWSAIVANNPTLIDSQHLIYALLGLPSSWGVAYVVTALNGVIWE